MRTFRICFDMDGTIADLYANPNWLAELRAYDPAPYANAKPIGNMNWLARRLNMLKGYGFQLVVVSWLSKTSTPEYDEAVTLAKLNWLKKHLPSVEWDEINIVPYGTPKQIFSNGGDILFDDEERNRENWENADGDNIAFTPEKISEVLAYLIEEQNGAYRPM